MTQTVTAPVSLVPSIVSSVAPSKTGDPKTLVLSAEVFARIIDAQSAIGKSLPRVARAYGQTRGDSSSPFQNLVHGIPQHLLPGVYAGEDLWTTLEIVFDRCGDPRIVSVDAYGHRGWSLVARIAELTRGSRKVMSRDMSASTLSVASERMEDLFDSERMLYVHDTNSDLERAFARERLSLEAIHVEEISSLPWTASSLFLSKPLPKDPIDSVASSRTVIPYHPECSGQHVLALLRNDEASTEVEQRLASAIDPASLASVRCMIPRTIRLAPDVELPEDLIPYVVKRAPALSRQVVRRWMPPDRIARIRAMHPNDNVLQENVPPLCVSVKDGHGEDRMCPFRLIVIGHGKDVMGAVAVARIPSNGVPAQDILMDVRILAPVPSASSVRS